MSKYDLIAFDMDGTLLNPQKQISAVCLDAIHRASAAGKTVCLDTGRCIPELQEFFPILTDVRYIIGESGVFIFDVREGSYIYNAPMDIGIAVEIFRRIQASGEDVLTHIHCDRSIVQADKIPRMEEFKMEIYRPMYERVCTTVDDIFSFFLSDPFAPNKINVYCKNMEQWGRIHKLLSDLDVEFNHVEALSLECIPRGRTKGNGLRRLCNHLSIPIERSIAVGDADNDLEMLVAAGLAVAMGNSNENVLAAADVVVADNAHDGCAEAIERFLLES